jgi:1,2-diacylglycerol-3-alpha-glucose alpha-1,2-galactosyltransferase
VKSRRGSPPTRSTDGTLGLHIVSETAFGITAQGVHTAFLDAVEMFAADPRLDVKVNEAGPGEVMHSHTYGPYYLRWARRYRGRSILTVHTIPDSVRGSLPLWRLFLPLARAYFRFAYSRATVCIAIAPYVEQAILATKARTRIVRINNPINVEKFRRTGELRQSGRELLGMSDTQQLVLCVGQLQQRKGVEDCIDVARRCPELNFVWVGGRPFGLATEGVIRINRAIGNAPENTSFPGIVAEADMPKVYAAADMLMFPSYQENSPLVPIEAAASGVPVIFRDLPEYRALYQTPYLHARSNDEFAATLRRMAGEPAFRREAEAMSTRLLEQFDRQQIHEQLVALYTELANTGRD